MIKNLSIVFVIVLLNCASINFIGNDFNYKNFDKLILGSTNREKAEKLLGAPIRVEGGKDENGDYLLLHYFCSYGVKNETLTRTLILEFRNGLLNSYLKRFTGSETGKQSSVFFNENIYDKSNEIIKGSHTIKDVFKLLGIPSIKGYCNSSIKAIKESCNVKSEEIWIYFNFVNNESRSVSIVFDKNGLVLDINRKIE